MFRNLIILGLLINAGQAMVLAQAACDGKQIFTEKACAGDNVMADEKSLFEMVAMYRSSNGLPAAKLSTALSKLANRHLIDIKVNIRSFTHSWSNCPYDIKDEKTWPCVIDAPARMNSGYLGQGYETLYVTSEKIAKVSNALDSWKKSTLHNSIITNQGMFKDLAWEEIGVAVDGSYVALWFGTPKKAGSMGSEGSGLGITYEQVVAGLSKIVAIKQESTTIEATKWQGTSPDKKIKMEIFGTKKDVSEAKLSVTAKLEADKSLSPKSFDVLATLLKNAFPSWPDREAWLLSSLKAIGANSSVERTKIIGKNLVEIRHGAGGSIVLQIVPQAANRAIEIN